MKKLALLGFAILVGVAAFAGTGFVLLTERLGPVAAEPVPLDGARPFRSWPEHDAIYLLGQFPYIVEHETDRGAVLYFGAKHSSDPADPQFERMREAWDRFAPTVALNEGRARYFRFFAESMNGVSDPAVVYALARRDGIPIFSLEPEYEDEVAALLTEWPADVVACYVVLRVVAAESGGDPSRAEKIAPALIRKRTDVDGLRGSINTVQDLDLVWATVAPDGPDWRTLNNTETTERLRAVGDASREIRGRHMVRAIATLVGQGERVFAVVGASHVIRHEPTLQDLLGTRSVTPHEIGK
ncbi:MAG: hypothetical protein RLN60_02965 [Phycisphaerales bacterium]